MVPASSATRHQVHAIYALESTGLGSNTASVQTATTTALIIVIRVLTVVYHAQTSSVEYVLPSLSQCAMSAMAPTV